MPKVVSDAIVFNVDYDERPWPISLVSQLSACRFVDSNYNCMHRSLENEITGQRNHFLRMSQGILKKTHDTDNKSTWFLHYHLRVISSITPYYVVAAYSNNASMHLYNL